MRNKSLDAVKAIAACLVVCIHVSFPGQAGQLVKVLARCAVPFFFYGIRGISVIIKIAMPQKEYCLKSCIS